MKKIMLLAALITNAMAFENIMVDTQTNPIFDITFKEQKSAGYECYLSKYDPMLITPIKSSEHSKEGMAGSAKKLTWTFEAAKVQIPQMTMLTISCTRVWDSAPGIPDEEPQHQYRIMLK